MLFTRSQTGARASKTMVCPHGRQKYRCRECGGTSICEHGKDRSQCKKCGGSSFCEHGRQRCRCKECGGIGICVHGRLRYRCKECGGSSICEHGKDRTQCRSCGGSSFCEHGNQRCRCKLCGQAKAKKRTRDIHDVTDLLIQNPPLTAVTAVTAPLESTDPSLPSEQPSRVGCDSSSMPMFTAVDSKPPVTLSIDGYDVESGPRKRKKAELPVSDVGLTPDTRALPTNIDIPGIKDMGALSSMMMPSPPSQPMGVPQPMPLPVSPPMPGFMYPTVPYPVMNPHMWMMMQQNYQMMAMQQRNMRVLQIIERGNESSSHASREQASIRHR